MCAHRRRAHAPATRQARRRARQPDPTPSDSVGSVSARRWPATELFTSATSTASVPSASLGSATPSAPTNHTTTAVAMGPTTKNSDEDQHDAGHIRAMCVPRWRRPRRSELRCIGEIAPRRYDASTEFDVFEDERSDVVRLRIPAQQLIHRWRRSSNGFTALQLAASRPRRRRNSSTAAPRSKRDGDNAGAARYDAATHHNIDTYQRTARAPTPTRANRVATHRWTKPFTTATSR